MIKASKKEYSWGTLRTIQKGISYQVVIHPEHWVEIEKLIIGEVCAVDFTDEQKEYWKVTLNKDELTFTGSGNKEVTVKVTELE